MDQDAIIHRDRSGSWLATGTVFMLTLFWLFRKRTPASADAVFRRGQLVSAGMYSLGHGSNDAQKTMGSLRACSTRCHSTSTW